MCAEAQSGERAESQQQIAELRQQLREVEATMGELSDAGGPLQEGLELLARARGEMEREQIDEARSLLAQVSYLHTRVEKSKATVRRCGPVIVAYEIAFLLGLILLGIWGGNLPARFGVTLSKDWLTAAACALWGGLGGVASCFFGFHLSASGYRFDCAFLPQYFLKPVTGMALGLAVYAFVRAGLIAMSTGPIEEPWLLYVGAFALGFSWRLSLRLIDRVADGFFGARPAREEGAPAGARAAAAGRAPSASGSSAGN